MNPIARTSRSTAPQTAERLSFSVRQVREPKLSSMRPEQKSSSEPSTDAVRASPHPTRAASGPSVLHGYRPARARTPVGLQSDKASQANPGPAVGLKPDPPRMQTAPNLHPSNLAPRPQPKPRRRPHPLRQPPRTPPPESPRGTGPPQAQLVGCGEARTASIAFRDRAASTRSAEPAGPLPSRPQSGCPFPSTRRASPDCRP